MIRYAGRRLLTALLTLFLLTVLTFLMTTAARGDPALLALQRSGVEPTPELLRQTRERLGLTDPLPVRYTRWARGAVRGDLGRSFLTNRPVGEMLSERIRPTLSLGAATLAVSAILGIGLGAVTAVARRRVIDITVRATTLLLASIPAFWLSLGLILVLGERLRLLPVAGYGGWKHYVLPVTALSLGPTASLLRLTRGAVLDVLSDDYVRTARAKGLGSRTVLVRHVLRNAALPVFTLLGLRFGHILGGAVIVESIFAWPGMGTVLITAISGRDLPVIGGFVVITGLVVVSVNLTVDLICPLIDPRIRIGKAARA
ncbi:MAG: ABC transporter permease [Chloroflexi bacterium]|nr:ABC transporter permease [Chloroflexota bacterium]